MKKRSQRLEAAYVIFSMLMLTNGPLLLLLSGGSSQGDGNVALRSYPEIQVVFLSIYAICIYYLRDFWREALNRLVKERILLGILVLALVSAIWSWAPAITLRRAVALSGTLIFGVYLGTRYSVEQQIRLLSAAIGLSAFLSLIFAVWMPSYGIMAGPWHEGIWRGIYAHKNALGQVMSLGCLLFAFSLLNNLGHKTVLGIGLLFSIGLLILSASKTALLVTFCSFAVMGLFMLRDGSSRGVFLAMLVVVLSGSTLYAQTKLKYVVPIELSNWLRKPVEPIATPSATVKTNPESGHNQSKNPHQPGTPDWERIQLKQGSGRFPLWKTLVTQIRTHPFLGHGFGTFWVGESGPSGPVWKVHSWRPVHAHNGFLDLTLELGLCGLVLFSIGMASTIARALGSVHRKSYLSYWPALFLVYYVLCNAGESVLLKQNTLLSALYASVCIGAIEPWKEVDS